MPMLYRSPATRWFLAAVAIASGSVFTFGSAAKWRDTPSFHWLDRLPIPLQVWGVAVIAYGALLIFNRTRPVGYAAGAVLWAVFTASLLATLAQPGPKNVIVIAAMLDVIAFHLFSIRTAWAQHYAREAVRQDVAP